MTTMLKATTAATAPHDPLAVAARWLDEGRGCALATVVETWGSAAVPAGGAMAIAGEDVFQGSVSGGCVEADVIAAALDVIASGKPEMLSFGIDDETAWRSGLACGGKIRVFVSALDPKRDGNLLATIESAQAARQACVLATRLTDGARRLYQPNAENPAAVNAALLSGASGVAELDDGEVFLQALAPPVRVVIVGATHIAQILKQATRAIGYDVAILDPRSAFTSAERFDQDAVITAWPDASLAPLLDDPFSALVTLTHADNIDDEALAIALRSRCRYIGALGAKRTHQKRVSRLASLGFSEADISRIRAPIGLDIAAKSAGEIAISILGEIIAAFRGKLQS